MRSEQQMMDLIKRFVAGDPNIRAAVLNGSRANPGAKKDIFQDFDITCYVRSVKPYITDRRFLKQFGDLMIMQTPEDMEDPPPKNDGHYVYLMQFTDGNRIDLSFCPLNWLQDMEHESLTLVILDKDGRFEDLPSPSDRDFLPKEPTEKTFDDCCNEFWWVCPYVAKALWRDELLQAKSLLEGAIRTPFMKMVTWHFAIETEYRTVPGKAGKNIKLSLDPDLWRRIEATYSDSDFANIWDSLFVMGDVFRTTAACVAEKYDYKYPYRDDRNVTAHLLHVRQLPKDSSDMYPQ